MSKKNNLIWLDGMLNSCCRQSQCKVSDFPVNLSRQPSCTSRFFGLIVSIPESAGSYRSRTKLIHDSFINNIPCISNKNRYSINIDNTDFISIDSVMVWLGSKKLYKITIDGVKKSNLTLRKQTVFDTIMIIQYKVSSIHCLQKKRLDK